MIKIFSKIQPYEINDQNFIRFNTRRNRKLDLTEFYDLVYEYNNDCLTAGIKYKKLTMKTEILNQLRPNVYNHFFPLTVYEQRIDSVLNFKIILLYISK